MNDKKGAIIEPTVDYTKIPPIHQRRTISFINHFIVTTVAFLNKFSLSCEEKLFEFEHKLQKLEAAIVILESRLASVPSLRNTNANVENPGERFCETPVIENDLKPMNMEVITVNVDQSMENTIQTPNVEVVNKNPQYEKYFKMVNVGVPKTAVQLKMTLEGLDPSVLDERNNYSAHYPE